MWRSQGSLAEARQPFAMMRSPVGTGVERSGSGVFERGLMIAGGVEFDVKVDVVVDDMFAEEGEQSAGAVVAAELGAVELELCLTG